MAVTLKEVALAGGVSPATVSRALSDNPAISHKTRERIKQIAEELHYIPNMHARGLITKKTNVLGIVITRTAEFAFSNPFYGEILKGMGRKAREKGLYLLFSFDRQDYSSMFRLGLVQGIIVLGNRTDDPEIQHCWQKKIPMVLIPGYRGMQAIPSVGADSERAAILSVEYLEKLGHRNIAILNGLPTSRFSLDYFAGYRKAFALKHLPLRKKWVGETDFTKESAYRIMLQILSLPEKPTAVLAVSDYTALGALRAAQEMGYRVPQELSIIGRGDVPFASMTEPPLTTVRVLYDRIGEEAINMIVNISDGKLTSKKKHVLLPVELVLRQSTGPPLA